MYGSLPAGRDPSDGDGNQVSSTVPSPEMVASP
jgi:hypothetical protein